VIGCDVLLQFQIGFNAIAPMISVLIVAYSGPWPPTNCSHARSMSLSNLVLWMTPITAFGSSFRGWRSKGTESGRNSLMLMNPPCVGAHRNFHVSRRASVPYFSIIAQGFLNRLLYQ